MTPGGHLGVEDRAAWDLIPWVVAGTATAAERALVERHAATCADCAAELAFQRDVRIAVAATVSAPPHDAEPALRAMMARIDAGDETLRRTPARAGSRWPAVAAAVVLVQAVALAALAGHRWDRPPPAEYATLSRPETSRATLRLVPSPSLPLHDLQALLARFDLQIVEASADGAMFGLAPRGTRPADVAAVLAGLRATPGVLLAEPMADPGRGTAPVAPRP